ncbi:MAG: hypothetical protein ACOYXT_19450 [Bacteroidota bacterium]
MSNLTIKFSSNADFNVIRIDDEEIIFDENNIWKDGALKPGIHVLTWRMKGGKGDKYVLEIVSPASASWKREVTLDSFGLDFGYHEIEL